MSGWTHALCERCWGALEGERIPHRVKIELNENEACCRCGAATDSGIYYRADPRTIACGGMLGVHAAEPEL